MTHQNPSGATLHERTLAGIQAVIERGLGHSSGMEKTIVERAIKGLYPRMEQRIRRASHDDLKTELKYLYELLGRMLQDPSSKKNRGYKRSPRLKKKIL